MTTSDGNVIGTTTVVDHGPRALRWNLVVMGDGYQQGQMNQFSNDVQNFVNTLQTSDPFNTIWNAINIHRIDVTSTDSGADDPTGCGGSGASPRTYFDASFCNGGIQRLLLVDNATAISVANQQVPEWDMIMVIVNSTIYGGAGGSVAVFSLASNANEIAIHEMGHTAFGLADEYEYYAGCGSGETTQNRYTGIEPSEPNVTANANITTNKWRDLIQSSTAMPTTINANCSQCDTQASPVPRGTVGAFEGAYYHHCGAFRPEFDCKMRALGHPFCAVCRRVIVQNLKPFMPSELNWSFAGNTRGFGHGINDGRPFWIGDFNGDGKADVLFYYPGDDNWWLGSHDGSELRWSFAGNTRGFGHGINDGRPFWTGNFSRSDRAQVLFYYPGDDNWWLGSHDGSELRWSFAGNTRGFGHGINDGRPFWTGNFSRSDRAQVLFYYPGDDNWWLGSHDGSELRWSFAGNTRGFGHGINDGRPFWIGDFNGDGKADVLFYYPGDDNWWLGSHDGSELRWSFAGNTRGFGHGINDGRPFWIGDFNGDGKADVLFYYPGDDNWWLGSHDGSELRWSFAGNTRGFGHGINDGRPFWIGDFNGDGKADVLFYYPGDDNWWLGSHDGSELRWSFAGNTRGFGHGINDGRPFWTGNFSRSDRAQVLFYYPGDDNWWLGTI